MSISNHSGVFFVLLCLGSTPAEAVCPSTAELANDSFFQKGYIDASLCGANPADNGVDDTAGLQAAIDFGLENRLVVYIPNQANGQPGNYLISDTLRAFTHGHHNWCIEGVTDCIPTTSMIIGSTQGTGRPLFRLAPNVAHFGDPSLPQPAIWFWSPPLDNLTDTDPYHFDHDVCFEFYFRGIDIDLNKNPGAIGIMNPAAQGGLTMNSKILATGAFAGIRHFGILSGGAIYNVEVIGGKYGVFMDPSWENKGMETGAHAMIYGSIFSQQEVATFYIKDEVYAFFCVGCSISSSTSPIVIGSLWASAFNFVDSIIEMTNGGRIIADKTQTSFRNVYVQGASEVTNGWAISNPKDWTWIKEYFYSDSSHPRYALIDGISSQGGETKNKLEDQPVTRSQLLASLVEVHRLRSIPTFDEPSVVSVKDFGALGDGKTDDTLAIQTAINSAEKVLMPKGTYRVSKTLDLKPNSKLFGVSSEFTAIVPLDSWSPVGEVPIIRTANDANGTAFLGDLRIHTIKLEPVGTDGFTAVHWRTGRYSSSLDLTATHGLWTSTASDDFNYNYYRFKFTDNAGGMHFSPLARYVQMNGGRPEARSIQIVGTTQPLAIYAFNSAWEPGNITSEITNSQNVRYYYTTHEQGKSSIQVHNSQNIAVFGGHKNNYVGDGRGGLEFYDSSDVLVDDYTFRLDSTAARYALKEVFGGVTKTISAANYLGLFKRGEPSFTPIAPIVDETLSDAGENEGSDDAGFGEGVLDAPGDETKEQTGLDGRDFDAEGQDNGVEGNDVAQQDGGEGTSSVHGGCSCAHLELLVPCIVILPAFRWSRLRKR